MFQDHVPLKWSLKGVIIEGRESEDGTVRSYVVRKENGRETIRSSRHIKFTARRGETRIRFEENTDNEAMDTSDDHTEN